MSSRHPNGREWSSNFGTQGGDYSRAKTHCVRGHEYTEENTGWRALPSTHEDGPTRYKRWCRACNKENQQNLRDRRKAEKINAQIMALWAEVQAEADD